MNEPLRDGGTARLDATLSILNAIVGDHLRRRSNPLQIELALYEHGLRLACERDAIARAHREASGRICVLVHGLATNERVWGFPGEPERSYGTMLQRDLGHTPFQVRYNSGLHVWENGALLAALLDALVAEHPVHARELVLVGHSMGGLVVRSACEAARAAGQRWLQLVSHAFYLGSPHHGAALEKVGHAVVRVLQAIGLVHTRAIADVANVRSAGIKDLRLGSVVRVERDGPARGALLDPPVPLARGVAHHFGVGGLAAHERHVLTRLFGDAMVSVASASGCREPRAAEARGDVRFFPRVGHVALAHDEQVYRWIRAWCAGERRAEVS